MKDVEIIEEFLYNGVDTGIWDLAQEEESSNQKQAPESKKKKKKKSSNKKKRNYINPERQTNEEDLEADEAPYIPFLIG